MSEVKKVAAVIGAVFVGVVVLAVYFGYRELESLRERNELLTESLQDMNMVLTEEIARSARVEEATQRLENREHERQTQFLSFEKRLSKMAAQSQEVRSVLSVVIPPELVRGLHAFPESE